MAVGSTGWVPFTLKKGLAGKIAKHSPNHVFPIHVILRTSPCEKNCIRIANSLVNNMII